MKTKTGKKVTALLTGVLLLGVTSVPVFAASGMDHEGGMHDTRVMAQMGITPEQMAKMVDYCSQQAQKAVKEASKEDLQYDSVLGWSTEEQRETFLHSIQ